MTSALVDQLGWKLGVRVLETSAKSALSGGGVEHAFETLAVCLMQAADAAEARAAEARAAEARAAEARAAEAEARAAEASAAEASAASSSALSSSSSSSKPAALLDP